MKDLCTPTPFQPGAVFTATHHQQPTAAPTAAPTASVHLNLNQWVEDIAKGLFTGIEEDAHARFSYALAQHQLDRAVVENQMKTEFRKVALMVLNTLGAADGPLKGLTPSQARAFEPIGRGARWETEEEVHAGATHQESARTEREEERYNFAALKVMAGVIDEVISKNQDMDGDSKSALQAMQFAIDAPDYAPLKKKFDAQHAANPAFNKLKR